MLHNLRSFAACARCPETRRPALALVCDTTLCANCRAETHNRSGRRGHCEVCWRDGLPVQRHHPGRALWHPTWVHPVCRSCHLVLTAMQRDAMRWDRRESFHDLQDAFGADHGWHELSQGTLEMAQAWGASRPLFAPDWMPQDSDGYVLIPLAPAAAVEGLRKRAHRWMR